MLGKRISVSISLCLFLLSLLSVGLQPTNILNAQENKQSLKLAGIFSDNMVLQRDMPIKIWGQAPPQQVVKISIDSATYQSTTDNNGKWIATVPARGLGKPFIVNVQSGDESVQLKNCVAGDVWICSGQSNMEWWVNRSKNSKKEIAAGNHPQIRHFKVAHRTAYQEQDKLEGGGWEICSPATVGDFSAVGYYFGRHLNQELNVPIGLLNTSWGGTIVETWTSAETLASHPDFTAKVKAIRETAADPTTVKQFQQRMKAWQAKLQTALTDQSEMLQATELDDQKWKQINVPAYWEGQGFGGYDGAFWYRKKVTLPADWVGQDLVFHAGQMDDGDQTYVNGSMVGQTSSWNAKRVYPVSADLVKNKSLQIAIRVTDSGGGGGIYGGPLMLKRKDGAGKPIELNGKWKFKPSLATTAAGRKPTQRFTGPNHGTKIYNRMVYPLHALSFRGVIWYQGESNAGRAYQYRQLFPLLIKDWRKKWQREIPFYWVQLANFGKPAEKPGESKWAELREAQTMTLNLPATGQAVTIDIGEAWDIHPKNKQDVGKRLALIALANEYGREVAYSGPMYRSMNVNGGNVTVTFDHADGLMAKDGKLRRFELAGADHVYHSANASVVGGNVVVNSDRVSAPIAVRYAWADNPSGCNLYNSAGLPASPFRSDDWPRSTRNNK